MIWVWWSTRLVEVYLIFSTVTNYNYKSEQNDVKLLAWGELSLIYLKFSIMNYNKLPVDEVIGINFCVQIEGIPQIFKSLEVV